MKYNGLWPELTFFAWILKRIKDLYQEKGMSQSEEFYPMCNQTNLEDTERLVETWAEEGNQHSCRTNDWHECN
jgi:hypothetical protein